MQTEHLKLLRLLQLADSALPVGAAAHSFGLETLVEDGTLNVSNLESFLSNYLCEAGAQEGAFCRAAHHLSARVDFGEHHFQIQTWLGLNRRLSARKLARESRAASAALGRRLLQLACALDELPPLAEASEAARRAGCDVHHCTAFGLAAGALGLDEGATINAYLHQSLSGLISACQRLMPLGQTRAQQILWSLKPAIVAAAASYDIEGGAFNDDSVIRDSDNAATEEFDGVCNEVCCFTPLLDLASMRHTTQTTRLFIS